MAPEIDRDTVKTVVGGKQYKLVIDQGIGVFEEVDRDGKPTHKTICEDHKLGDPLDAPAGVVYEVDFAGKLTRVNGKLQLKSGSGSCVLRHPLTADADAKKFINETTGEEVE